MYFWLIQLCCLHGILNHGDMGLFSSADIMQRCVTTCFQFKFFLKKYFFQFFWFFHPVLSYFYFLPSFSTDHQLQIRDGFQARLYKNNWSTKISVVSGKVLQLVVGKLLCASEMSSTPAGQSAPSSLLLLWQAAGVHCLARNDQTGQCNTRHEKQQSSSESSLWMGCSQQEMCLACINELQTVKAG